MRILLIDSARAKGSDATSTVELGRGLAERHNELTVVCHPRSATLERLGAVPPSEITLVTLRLTPNPYGLLQLARATRRAQPDVVLAEATTDVTLAVATRRLGARFPVVHRCGAPRELTDNRRHRYLWRREVQILLLNSHAARHHLLGTMPWLAGVRIEVIPDGKDTAYYRPVPKLRQRMRTELGIPEEAFVVSCHGTIDQGTNVDLLLRAVAVLPRHLNVLVLIVGTGPLLAETRRLATELRAPVIFTGTRADIPEVLSSADAAAHLSTSDTCSSIVLESLACGLPVIASDAYCHAEQVEDGVHGVLVPPQDWNSIADALRWLSSDPAERQRMSRAARERVIADFSLTRMIDRYEQVLRQAVEVFGTKR